MKLANEMGCDLNATFCITEGLFDKIDCGKKSYRCNPYLVCYRIQAKMRELREKQAKEREYAEIQDVVSRTFSSDEEHTYAGIGSLDSSVDSSSIDPYSHPYHLPQSPQSPHLPLSPPVSAPPVEAVYAQVNKPRNGRPVVPDR